MQAGLHCLDVPTEFLIDAVVGLGDGFVGVLNATAADAGAPGSEAPAAFAPAVQALAIGGHICMVLIDFRQLYVFRFAGESLVFFLHIGLQLDFSHYTISNPLQLPWSLSLMRFGSHLVFVGRFLC